MPTDLIGYDPQRVDGLRRALVAPGAHLLRTPAVADPLAASALSTVRLVRAHLGDEWLPTLNRVAASRAMLEFGGVGSLGGPVGWSFPGGVATPHPPGPPDELPVSWGPSNADARAAADAAVAGGRPGRFVGRTETYVVTETPPPTSTPASGHDPDGGSGQHTILVEDHWFFEHDLADPPAPYGATPVGGWITVLARLGRLAQDDAPDPAHERGRAWEQLCVAARGSGGRGGVGRDKTVAVGRLSTFGGDDTTVDYKAVSGDAVRPGYLGNAASPMFRAGKDRENDTEVKILEDVAQRLAPGTTASWRSSPNVPLRLVP